VEVLRHNHVPVDAELILLSSLLQNCEECLLDAIVTKQRRAPVTTAGDEVRPLCAVTAFQVRGHNQVECMGQLGPDSVIYDTDQCVFDGRRIGDVKLGGVKRVG